MVATSPMSMVATSPMSMAVTSPQSMAATPPRTMPLLSVASLSASFHTDSTLGGTAPDAGGPARAAAFRAAGSSLSLPVSCISQDLRLPSSPPPLSPLRTDFVLGHSGSTGGDSRWSREGGSPTQTHPLITVTINPLEQDEVTFIPTTPPVEENGTKEFFSERHLSIGSAGSLDMEGEERLLGHRLQGQSSFRRVSDISHIKELRKEVPGFSNLTSEFYEVVTTADPDTITLDSLHVRVLARCVTKYQPPDRKDASKWFVIITTLLTLLSFSYIFWFKNFSSAPSAGGSNH